MKAAKEICQILKDNGYEGYIVGGWVRDKIMNRPSSDIDITTKATPEQITSMFKKEHWRIVPTGIKHGTVTIIHRQLGSEYETTVFRKDVSCDGRHAEIEPADSIEEDLSRRDFRMNAMAYDPLTEKIIDPFGGQEDIKNKIIRTVGNAKERFQEDYLRMIRALRFKAVLEFELHEDIYCAIQKLADGITKISNERIRDEITKCFSKADKPSEMFNPMVHQAPLLHILFPRLRECADFLQNKYHKYGVLRHILLSIDAVPKEYPLIRWAALFHDVGKPATCKDYGSPNASFHGHEVVSARIAREYLNKLKFSNKDKDYIINLVRHHMFSITGDMKDGAIRRLVAKIGEENLDAITILRYADRCANGTKPIFELDIENSGIVSRLKKVQEKDAAFKISDLAIDGKDVMEAKGIKQGKEIGSILKDLFEKVLDNPELNNREDLLKLV